MSLQGLIQESQRIYKESLIGLCYLDTDLRFVHINDWLAEINGIPAEEHIGRTLGELIPNVAAGVEVQFRQVIDTGEPIIGGTVEAETSAQPGIKRHFQHNYYPVKSDDGEVIGISCVVEDVTVRNEALAALQQANDGLEQRDQERTATKRSQRATAEILEQVAQFAYAPGISIGLHTAQWAALRYFHQAEDDARTVGRLAEYNMTTPSSASQAIEKLVNRGFLRRAKGDGDRRSYRVDLTPSGRRLLAKDPLNMMVDALSALPAEDQLIFTEHLGKLYQNVLSQVAASRGSAKKEKKLR